MKKIAVNTVKSFLKENKRNDAYTQTFTVGDSSFEVVFHTALTIEEKSTFINRVISGCFDSTGKFRPEYYSPMLRATVLQICTNIPPITLKNETDGNGIPALDLNGMNELYLLMDLDHIQNDEYQIMLKEMERLCEDAVNYKKGNPIFALSDALNAIVSKIDEFDTKQLMQFAGDLSNATKGLDESGILQGLLKLHEGKSE